MLGGGVGDALGIAVRRVEHVVGVPLDGSGNFGVSVGRDGKSVGKHHFRERCRYVGNGDVCKTLQRRGSRAVDGGFVVTLHSLVSGRIVECVITVDVDVRAVCGGCVFVENNIRGVGEHYGIEGVAEFVDCGVLEGAEYFGAVVGYVQHFSEFERSDFVGDVVESVYTHSGDYLNRLVRSADVHPHVFGSVGHTVFLFFETGVGVDRGALGQPEYRDCFRDGGFALGGRVEPERAVDAHRAAAHRIGNRCAESIVGIESVEREQAVVNETPPRAVQAYVVEIGFDKQFSVLCAVVCLGRDVTVVGARSVVIRVVAGIVDRIHAVRVEGEPEFAADKAVFVRPRDISLGAVLHK